MKKVLILLAGVIFFIISVSFAASNSMVDSQTKTISEPITLLLAGSVLIVVGIVTRKRFTRK